MKLSIVVPVYNMAGEGKLEYCIRSLFCQTVDDYEIIAVDDASTDDSLAVLKRLQKEQPDKLKVIASDRNRHQGGARNIGIKAASGTYLGMMDSDDWAAPDMFEKLLRKAEETGADVVGCDFSLVHEHTMEVGKIIPLNQGNQTGELTGEKKRNIILDPGSMVVKIWRRQMIAEHDLWFPEDIFYEDNCMASLWLLHCRHFEKVNEPLYYYYQHENSTIHYVSAGKCDDRVRAMELMLEKSRQYGFYEEYPDEFAFKYIELAFVNTLFSCMGGKMKGKYTYVKSLLKRVNATMQDFDKNPYYREKIGAEEQKLIRILKKSGLLFFAYYNLLKTYRSFKKRRK